MVVNGHRLAQYVTDFKLDLAQAVAGLHQPGATHAAAAAGVFRVAITLPVTGRGSDTLDPAQKIIVGHVPVNGLTREIGFRNPRCPACPVIVTVDVDRAIIEATGHHPDLPSQQVITGLLYRLATPG